MKDEMDMDSQMIVKVQMPLAGEPQVLVYDETRTKQGMFDVTPDIKRIMRGRAKAFFHATLANGTFDIGDEAPWQAW